jgi:hypothetical protein
LSHRRALLFLICAFLLTTQLRAQPSSQPWAIPLTADKLVDQLIANADQYRATLPSLTAQETILSKLSQFLKIPYVVHAEATIRVTRKLSEDHLDESRQFTIINGKPVDSTDHTGIPFIFHNPLSGYAEEFFTREDRPCFTFVLSPQRHRSAPLELSIATSPGAAEHPQCKNWNGVTGIVRIDAASHQLIHSETTYPETLETPKFHRRFASLDYAPVKIGQNTFWLPTTSTMYAVNGKVQMEWIAHYSDYRQFTATSTILPASPAESQP